MTVELNKIYNMDCLDYFLLLKDESVDMLFVDLPFGITNSEVEESFCWW